MSDDTKPEPTEGGKPPESGEGQQEKTFTQAELDKAIKDRLKRERDKFADYDELKKQAEGAKTLEDRVAEVEQRAKDAEANALRANIANEHGISAEDRDLFLTGTDEETLTTQAKRLADREDERKKSGNHVPNEGRTPNPPKATAGEQFAQWAEGQFTH